MAGEVKQTVAQIIIERFLKDVDERGTMPWQRPYERYESFNYFTKKAYRGINRLLLPSGEYLTRNQINQYNKSTGEDFRFQKGIEWIPIVFFKPDVKNVSAEEMRSAFPDVVSFDENWYGRHEGWLYYVNNGRCLKRRNILRYYLVAERRHFKNSKGEMLPSRIETGEIVITRSEPQQVIDEYVKRSGVTVVDTIGTPCYKPMSDIVELNHMTVSEEEYFSTAFHEFAHSTGHASRLCREGVVSSCVFGSNLYAKEECIAEITACLCCAETGISTMQTSGLAAYDNSIAYVQFWKSKVREWGKEFIYIASQADKAFQYICPAADAGMESSDGEE